MPRVTHLNAMHRGADGLTLNADDLGIDAIPGLSATDIQGALEEIAFGPADVTLTSLTNKSGAQVDEGDVLIIGTANDDSFTTTTTAALERTVMIAAETIANNATGLVRLAGYTVTVNTNGVSATRGHYLYTSTTAKVATASASRVAGAFGQVLNSGADPEAIIWGNGDPAGGTVSEITSIPTAETDTSKRLAPDGAGGVEWGTGGSVSEILDIPTAETDTTLRLAPDGAGGVEWAAPTGGGNTLVGTRVYGSGVQSITENSDNVASFDTELYDTDALFASDKFTADRDGYWRFDYHIFWDAASATGIRYTYLRLNGTTKIEGSNDRRVGSTAINVTNVGGATVFLSNGDYVEVMVFQNRGGGTALNSGFNHATNAAVVNTCSMTLVGT
jgi:hypothetical protein